MEINGSDIGERVRGNTFWTRKKPRSRMNFVKSPASLVKQTHISKENGMAGRTWWVVVLTVVVGVMSVDGGWNATLAQLEGPRNWEFFTSPTRNPKELRWGTYNDIRREDRESAAAKHNYCPTGGCVVRLDKLAITPNRIQRGRYATLTLSYTILTADDIGVPVTISREIIYQGRSVGKTSSRNMRTPNGTFDQELAFNLPENSPPGKYTLKTKISTGFAQDEKSIDFTVD
jgi:hypothetical protein